MPSGQSCRQVTCMWAALAPRAPLQPSELKRQWLLFYCHLGNKVQKISWSPLDWNSARKRVPGNVVSADLSWPKTNPLQPPRVALPVTFMALAFGDLDWFTTVDHTSTIFLTNSHLGSLSIISYCITNHFNIYWFKQKTFTKHTVSQEHVCQSRSRPSLATVCWRQSGLGWLHLQVAISPLLSCGGFCLLHYASSHSFTLY